MELSISRYFHLTRGRGVNRRSASKHFVADKMQTNHLWGVSLIEMAIHGVANLLPKCVQSVRFRKDGLTQSPRRKAAFRGFLDEKKDFVHTLRAKESQRFTVDLQESCMPTVTL